MTEVESLRAQLAKQFEEQTERVDFYFEGLSELRGEIAAMLHSGAIPSEAAHHLDEKCETLQARQVPPTETENDRLKRLCRFQWMTLGYYSTPYNYDPKNIVIHPISGEVCSGILHDGGEQAREADEVMKKLGFTADEIRSWPGPKTVVTQQADKVSSGTASDAVGARRETDARGLGNGYGDPRGHHVYAPTAGLKQSEHVTPPIASGKADPCFCHEARGQAGCPTHAPRYGVTEPEYDRCPHCQGSFSFTKPDNGRCFWCKKQVTKPVPSKERS